MLEEILSMVKNGNRVIVFGKVHFCPHLGINQYNPITIHKKIC